MAMKRVNVDEPDKKLAAKPSEAETKNSSNNSIQRMLATTGPGTMVAAAATTTTNKKSKDGTDQDPKKATTQDALNEDELFDKSHSTFPEKLMGLLDEEEAAREAMWWLPGGDAFTIVPKNFSEKILDIYFQGTKFESFTRKLNRWGFKRVAGQRVPPDTIAYHHPLFIKGDRDKVKQMRSGKRPRESAPPFSSQKEARVDVSHLFPQPPVPSLPNFLQQNMQLAQTQLDSAAQIARGANLHDFQTDSQLLRRIRQEELLLQEYRQSFGPLGNASQNNLQLQALLASQQQLNPSLPYDLQLQLLAAEQARQSQGQQRFLQQQQQHQNLLPLDLHRQLLLQNSMPLGGLGLSNNSQTSNSYIDALLNSAGNNLARAPSSALDSSIALSSRLGGFGQQNSQLVQLLLLEEEERKRREQGQSRGNTK